MPMMKSQYDQILSTPDGRYSITVKADVPVLIPPVAERYAKSQQMEVVGDAPPTPAVEAPAETTDNEDEDEFSVTLDQAILRLLTRNEESDFKNDGTPKVNSVVEEIGPDVRRPTATEVSDSYQRLQENIDLAE